MSTRGRISRPAGRTSGATYSACGLYRYRLWRRWDERGTLAWIMLNPSTADDRGNNDATIERCERRGLAWGFGGVEIVNLFAFRSPDPAALRRAAAPIGPDNDQAILAAVAGADLILCGWGRHGTIGGRAVAVRTLLGERRLACLGLTRTGEPAHPLYLPYARKPVSYGADGS
jgi:hypothetical protein